MIVVGGQNRCSYTSEFIYLIEKDLIYLRSRSWEEGLEWNFPILFLLEVQVFLQNLGIETGVKGWGATGTVG